ncbi:KAP family P-loop NTPase fold protein [Nitrosomonas oligotropha]|uniref:KAP family P-loop domain-containing protein n=1 Tax=Nitrosomonas oligotropha TaxID=42354 RepID=A0A1H8Q4Z2_9PROT|nr:P-loop NTPase fold protein [Nitrosomonas oligotropha]SDW69210.1 KAP family P-loop domain-containing protein [Nitrosomonas oligotropha]SEO49031.1 KAP family P-loop domain-containing protein [Nitrosomonas oligotropha]
MSVLNLLGDQPARIDSDRLHFQRYLTAVEATVLNRNDPAPFVTGIFGPWGSGKSTLLGMLENRLDELNVGTAINQSKWVIIKFPPWLYSQEESLLVPLLALLAHRENVFKPLIKKMTETTKRFLKRTSATLDFDKLGMPLKISLNNLADKNSDHKFFHEEIATAIKTITEKKRLVFLIDDLDRCHDPAQIVHLLEQIKLFLHLDGCLFFIAADRQQVVDAIDKTFPGSGAAYLEKFVQLAFDLPPHHSGDLVRMLPSADAETLRAYRPLCEVLGNNPRKLKLIWNEAVLRMAILKEELHTNPQTRQHTPDLNLLLRWLLIRNRGELAKNPYRYLEFEQRKKTATQEEQQELRKEFSRMLQLANDTGQWYSEEDQRLAVFYGTGSIKMDFITRQSSRCTPAPAALTRFIHGICWKMPVLRAAMRHNSAIVILIMPICPVGIIRARCLAAAISPARIFATASLIERNSPIAIYPVCVSIRPN